MNAAATLNTLETAYNLRHYAEEIKNDSTQAWTIYHTLNELIQTLEMQVRHDSAKTAGNASALKVIEKMLKSKHIENRPVFQFPWYDKENRQCLCDGFRAFRLVEHLALPKRPDDVGNGIDLNMVFPDMKNYQALKLPTPSELKAYISTEKAKHGRKYVPIWDFGEDLPLVNAQYLLDLMVVIPDAEVILYNPVNLIAPLYVHGRPNADHPSLWDEAILLPVRKKEDKETDCE